MADERATDESRSGEELIVAMFAPVLLCSCAPVLDQLIAQLQVRFNDEQRRCHSYSSAALKSGSTISPTDSLYRISRRRIISMPMQSLPSILICARRLALWN